MTVAVLIIDDEVIETSTEGVKQLIDRLAIEARGGFQKATIVVVE